MALRRFDKGESSVTFGYTYMCHRSCLGNPDLSSFKHKVRQNDIMELATYVLQSMTYIYIYIYKVNPTNDQSAHPAL